MIFLSFYSWLAVFTATKSHETKIILFQMDSINIFTTQMVISTMNFFRNKGRLDTLNRMVNRLNVIHRILREQ